MGENTSKLTSPSQASAAESVPRLSESLRESSAANATKLKQSKLIQHSLTKSLASCTPYDLKKKTNAGTILPKLSPFVCQKI